MSGADLGCLLERVDPCSARIVWHLMWEGHAHLADLSRVTGLDRSPADRRDPVSLPETGCWG